jgi:BirA family transcriptional regulator, biotin operon repressor / biotin---[acetyl-CoA-carboxylase] ligase
MPAENRLSPEVLAQCAAIARVEYHETLGSTQDRACEIARSSDIGALPLVVVAEEQTAGRGRGTNRWWDGRGGLSFSLLFDPADWSLPAEPRPERSLAVGVAIVDAIQPLAGGHDVGLHWPNDVFAAGRKLAGVLIEVLPGGRHVIGIGLNVNNDFSAAPDDVRARATSLAELSGRSYDRTELLCDLLMSLKRSIRESAARGDKFGRRFGELCQQIGHELTIDRKSVV